MTATLTRPAPPAVPQAFRRPALDVVLPVYDEQRNLEPCVLLHAMLRARFSGAQCGFKAIRREVAQPLLPLVQDTGPFFDTELLVLADLRRAARLGRALATGQLPIAALRAQLGRAPLLSPPLTSHPLTSRLVASRPAS
jgi:hypothetical protein